MISLMHLSLRQSYIDDIQKTDMSDLETEESAKHLKIFKKSKEEIPNWELVSNFQFLKTFNTVNKAVEDKLTLKINDERITVISLQHFLQKINNNEFNTREDAKKNEEEKINNSKTESAKKYLIYLMM